MRPALLAHEALNGAFHFDTTPMAPLSHKCLVHIKPTQWTSWRMNSLLALLCWPSNESLPMLLHNHHYHWGSLLPTLSNWITTVSISLPLPQLTELWKLPVIWAFHQTAAAEARWHDHLHQDTLLDIVGENVACPSNEQRNFAPSIWQQHTHPKNYARGRWHINCGLTEHGISLSI